MWPLAGPGTRAKRADETGSELKGQRASADLNYSARQCWPIGAQPSLTDVEMAISLEPHASASVSASFCLVLVTPNFLLLAVKEIS